MSLTHTQVFSVIRQAGRRMLWLLNEWLEELSSTLKVRPWTHLSCANRWRDYLACLDGGGEDVCGRDPSDGHLCTVNSYSWCTLGRFKTIVTSPESLETLVCSWDDSVFVWGSFTAAVLQQREKDLFIFNLLFRHWIVKQKVAALACEACFRWARSREVLRPPVSSRFCRINQGGGSRAPQDGKAFTVFLTPSRAGEFACMSTSQTPRQQTDTRPSAGRSASHAGIFTASGFHYGCLSTWKHVSGRGWSHPLITGAIMKNGCFPVALFFL